MRAQALTYTPGSDARTMVTHVDPGRFSAFSPLYDASENGTTASAVSNGEAGSIFSGAVNLLAVAEAHQGDEDSPATYGIPPQQRHVMYECRNGAFTTHVLHEELVANMAVVRDRKAGEEVRQRSVSGPAPASGGRAGGRQSLVNNNTGNYSAGYAQDFHSAVLVLLRGLRELELLARAFATGAALLSLLAVRVGVHQEAPLDDPLLLYFAIAAAFDSSIFLFLFLLLLTTALAPLAYGVSEAQWREKRRKQLRRPSDSNGNQQQQQQQQLQRRRTEHCPRFGPSVTFADTGMNMENVSYGSHEQGRTSVVTESPPVLGMSIGRNDTMTVGSHAGSLAVPRASDSRLARQLAAAESNASRRLLGTSSNSPWRLLLAPTIWLYAVGLVFSVVQIACTTERTSRDMLNLRTDGHDVTAGLLLAVICVRACLLVLALLLDFATRTKKDVYA
ncbi:hypothetical protein DQ04_00391100 [Trypanosoma grayi]|uniref:hypothetical protein n=1 Tax=Trypanosoma grayi TaxID=71804 RepID=UPI0004F46C4D|nr:hypothetical protein DQ04_00391100 [Trypanosoma grayi]KEG14588.1 hypothetical protein DQ04_00391100 [Trypanosoma grayi]